jgi:hypothetical protein
LPWRSPHSASQLEICPGLSNMARPSAARRKARISACVRA